MSRVKYFLWLWYRAYYFIFKQRRAFRKNDLKKVTHLLRPLVEKRIGKLPYALSEPYVAWLEVNSWSSRRESSMEKGCESNSPLISIVMPCYNPPLDFFEEAISSIKNQTYGNWELCICNDASTDEKFEELIQNLITNEKRIKYLKRESNGNISLATNCAVDLAEGEFVLLMDQDDLITYNALSEVAKVILNNPTVDLIYSDDDKITEGGERFAPQFKPDWAPETLLSSMYLGHLICVKRSLFGKVEGMRKGFEGAQDFDFILRLSELVENVIHIPKVLYHWRVLPGSTALSGNEKPASFEAGERAVREALVRRHINARVVHPSWAKEAGCGVFDLEFPHSGPVVTLLIPTKNNKKVLERCVNSLVKTLYQNYKVIIVNNMSDDEETLNYLKTIKHQVIDVPNPSHGKFNFSYVNNRALDSVNSEYVLFLNDDTEVIDEKWLSQMMGYIQFGNIGVVGAKLLFPNNKIQHAGIVHGYYDGLAGPCFRNFDKSESGYLGYLNITRNVSAVTGACLLTRTKLFKELKGFDEESFGVAYNDVDFCLKVIKENKRVVWCHSALLYHHEGVSRGFIDNPQEIINYKLKYADFRDKFYNPNLSLDNEAFQISSRTLPITDNPIKCAMFTVNLNLEGAPNSQLELTLGLMKKGVINPIVVSPSDGPLRKKYNEAGIPVHILKTPIDNWSFKKSVGIIAQFLRRERVELVYANTVLSFYAIEASRIASVPCILNPRESEDWRSYFNHFTKKIREVAYRSFQYPYSVIFVAHATKKVWMELNTKNNFHVIHNGLDRKRFQLEMSKFDRSVERKRLSIKDEEVVVLCLGTVCFRKGQLDIVEAVKHLSEDSNYKVLVVGDRNNNYSEKIKSLISKLPSKVASRVLVLPESKDIGLFYGIADVFVCSSRIESFPRVILEAMAAGLPIITTNVFGIIEQVVENQNALFYEPSDSRRLAKHLDLMISDGDLRTRFGKNSELLLDRIVNYEQMVDRYAELFKEAWTSSYPRLGSVE